MEIRVASALSSFRRFHVAAAPGFPFRIRCVNAYRCALRISPARAPSGCAGGGIFRLPRSARPSAPPVLEPAVAHLLRSRDCACRQSCGFPRASSSGLASGSYRESFLSRPFPGRRPMGWPDCSGVPHLPAAPSLRLRVSPNPASTAGSMMTPDLPEPCIPGLSRG